MHQKYTLAYILDSFDLFDQFPSNVMHLILPFDSVQITR